MVTFREFFNALRQLEIDRTAPVIAHTSLSSFGEVHGGADTVLGALMGAYNTILMPAFTYKTMVIPEVGPPDNALRYGSGSAVNRMSEFFSPDMPADKLMGIVPETLRRRPGVHRSRHPILSFAGVNAEAALNAQTLDEPLAPIHALALDDGWVLLLGVNHTTNTSIHYAERMVSRKQFTRWALTPAGIVECPGFPGCSDGFHALAPHVAEIARSVLVGQALVTAVPIQGLVETVGKLIAADPLALLCGREECERCNAVRSSVSVKQ